MLLRAHTLAGTYGLAAMDAIHIAFALEAGVHQFISAECHTNRNRHTRQGWRRWRRWRRWLLRCAHTG